MSDIDDLVAKIADGEYDTKESLTQALEQLIQKKVVEARIDELERCIRGMHMVSHLMDEAELKERIATLKGGL